VTWEETVAAVKASNEAAGIAAVYDFNALKKKALQSMAKDPAGAKLALVELRHAVHKGSLPVCRFIP